MPRRRASVGRGVAAIVGIGAAALLLAACTAPLPPRPPAEPPAAPAAPVDTPVPADAPWLHPRSTWQPAAWDDLPGWRDDALLQAREKGLLEEESTRLNATLRGRQYLNSLLELFL